MFRQNINLYSSFQTIKPTITYLSWRHLVLGCIAFIFLLILSYIFNISDLYYQKYRLESLNKQVALLQTQFENKKKQYPAFFFSENVAKVVAEQEQRMQLELQLLEKIANSISFSNIMLSLGHIDVAEVWLTEINIDQSGYNINLRGNSLSMPSLKSYFAQIENNEFFKNDHLTLNTVDQDPKENYPDFQTYIISITKAQNEKTNS